MANPAKHSDTDDFRVNLQGANIRRTSLRNASLRGANLSRANMTSVDLRGADLADANLKGTILIGADLRDVRNLTRKQLAEAIVDATTILPERLG